MVRGIPRVSIPFSSRTSLPNTALLEGHPSRRCSLALLKQGLAFLLGDIKVKGAEHLVIDRDPVLRCLRGPLKPRYEREPPQIIADTLDGLRMEPTTRDSHV